MPWKETCVIDERTNFVREWLKKERSLTELCKDYGVSRKTGYKWMERFMFFGMNGLRDQSRAPHDHPNRTSAEIQKALLTYKRVHLSFGPKKVVSRLSRQQPGIAWPSPSTVGGLFRDHGLTRPRRSRFRTPVFSSALQKQENANDVWAIDFKGWFRTGDGMRVDPLTISDTSTRFLLLCQAVPKANFAHVQVQLEQTFRTYGLPLAIRSDNGPPFASTAIGGLSPLAVWLIRLGIVPERIRPGHPEENGRHERLHKTLKEATATPPKPTFREQQKSFDAFREEYNEERPHESLGMKTPAECYAASSRSFPSRLPQITYPADFIIRQVRSAGEIKWESELLYVNEALAGQPVGLKQIANNFWDLHFGPVHLGTLNSKTKSIKQPVRVTKVLPMCPV